MTGMAFNGWHPAIVGYKSNNKNLVEIKTIYLPDYLH